MEGTTSTFILRVWFALLKVTPATDTLVMFLGGRGVARTEQDWVWGMFLHGYSLFLSARTCVKVKDITKPCVIFDL